MRQWEYDLGLGISVQLAEEDDSVWTWRVCLGKKRVIGGGLAPCTFEEARYLALLQAADVFDLLTDKCTEGAQSIVQGYDEVVDLNPWDSTTARGGD